MPLARISNGMSGLDARNAINNAIDVVEPSLSNIAFSSVISPNYNDGVSRLITLTGNASLSAPLNGFNGAVWEGRFLASGASRSLSLGTGISTPTGVVFETSIASGNLRLMQLTFNNTKWLVTRNQEFN